MFTSNKIRSIKGFTLLEVMLVIIMLVLVFVPLLQMMATGIVASEEVKSTNMAVMLAFERGMIDEFQAAKIVSNGSVVKLLMRMENVATFGQRFAKAITKE